MQCSKKCMHAVQPVVEADPDAAAVSRTQDLVIGLRPVLDQKHCSRLASHYKMQREDGASKPCLCVHALTLPSVCMGVTRVVTGTGTIAQQPAGCVLWVQNYTHITVIQCDGPSAPSKPCFSHPWLPPCVLQWGIGIKKEPKTCIIRVFFHQKQCFLFIKYQWLYLLHIV